MIFKNTFLVVKLWSIIKMIHMISKILGHIQPDKILKKITINQLKELLIVIQI